MERNRLLSRIRKFCRAEDGAIGTVLAIAAPVIIGFTGLAIDYNIWKKEQTALSRVADSAAVAAAFAKSNGATDLEPYALADAEKNGFDASRESLAVSFSEGNVTVDLQRQSDRFLSSIITREPVILNSQANVELVEKEVITTEVVPNSGYPCITALDENPTTNRGIYMHNTAFINATDCGVHSNSEDVQSHPWIESASIYMRNAHIEADFIRSVGQTVVNDSNGFTTVNVEPQSGVQAFVDPFANLTPPVQGSCDNNGQTVNYVTTPTVLQPGTYCGDIIIQNGGQASFAPGVYNIINGDFLVRGGARIHDSQDVTFYFGGSNPGKWIIDNGTDVSLSAPSDGDSAGMLFWQSEQAQCGLYYNQQNKFAGGADFAFDGVIYAPNCGLVIDNNAQLSPSNETAHMSVHAAWIEMRGNTRLTAYGAPAEPELVSQTDFTGTTEVETNVVTTTITPQLRYSN